MFPTALAQKINAVLLKIVKFIAELITKSKLRITARNGVDIGIITISTPSIFFFKLLR